MTAHHCPAGMPVSHAVSAAAEMAELHPHALASLAVRDFFG